MFFMVTLAGLATQLPADKDGCLKFFGVTSALGQPETQPTTSMHNWQPTAAFKSLYGTHTHKLCGMTAQDGHIPVLNEYEQFCECLSQNTLPMGSPC